MTLHFRDIFPTEMTEEDKKLLVKMSDADYDGRKAVDLLAQVLTNRCGLIRLEGSITGLMLVRKTKDKLGWTLWIEGLAGEGLVENIREFEKEILKLAHFKSCQSISGIVERNGLAEIYKRMNCPVVAQIFRRILVDAEQTLPS